MPASTSGREELRRLLRGFTRRAESCCSAGRSVDDRKSGADRRAQHRPHYRRSKREAIGRRRRRTASVLLAAAFHQLVDQPWALWISHPSARPPGVVENWASAAMMSRCIFTLWNSTCRPQPSDRSQGTYSVRFPRAPNAADAPELVERCARFLVCVRASTNCFQPCQGKTSP